VGVIREEDARGASANPTEVELKFDVVDLPAARALIEGEALNGLMPAGPVSVANIVDRYVDTPSGALRRSGWVGRFRVREPGAGGTTIVLKTAARRSRGAVHVRDELEGPADPASPPAEWPASPARDRLLAMAGDEALHTTIVLDQRRRQRLFCDEGTEVEVSLDRVRTLVDERIVDRSLVLEVELKGGSPRRLEAIGESLGDLPYLLPAKTSKLDRALLVAERSKLRAMLPDPAVVRSPGVQPDDLLGEAGRKVLALHFARLLAREAGTREGRDPEELHQMRVATRRMRAAWRAFGDAFDPRATRSIRAGLRELASALGSVRDLDVLLAAIPAGEGESPGAGDGLRPFILALRSEREGARRRLFRLLERPGYQRWVAQTGAFLTTPGAGLASLAKASPRRIRETAPSRIWLAYGVVRSYGELLEDADVSTLHELRIAGKRLRYALEFIQETLGLAPDDAQAIGRYAERREREAARLRRTIGRVWSGVDGLGFRRHLGRAVARL
jgi:CHAD domain-containing protein